MTVLGLLVFFLTRNQLHYIKIMVHLIKVFTKVFRHTKTSPLSYIRFPMKKRKHLEMSH